MGYTHYWKQPQGLSEEKFKTFIKEVSKILPMIEESRKTKLRNGSGEKDTTPDIIMTNNQSISFNGEDAEGHETFYMSPHANNFIFCKTARKPYDLAVVVCLIAAKYHFGQAIEVTSDGTNEDWAHGLNVANEIGGYGIKSLDLEGEEGLTFEM